MKIFFAESIKGNIWIFGNFNVGTTSTNNKSILGSVQCWLNKESISNIFRIQKLEEMGFRITYYSRYRHYIVHTKDGGVQLNKN